VSRFARSARRPDHWASTHERARARAAERLAGELEPAEAAWLDEHLADCRACTATAATYDADRLALRALRDLPPQPPRDLWARTSSAIERESAARNRSGGGAQRSRLPLGALSGIAVIAIVVGVSTLSNLTIQSTPLPDEEGSHRSTTQGEDFGAFGAAPTPFAVGAGAVRYIASEGGLLAVNNVPIDEVCPADGTASCADLRDASAQRLDLAAPPRTIIGSPKGKDAIVVARDGSNGDQVFVVAMPATVSTPSSAASPAPPETMNPIDRTRPPASSAAPSAAVATDDFGSVTPSQAPASASVGSTEPSVAPSADVTASASPSPPIEASPSLSPEPSTAARLAIASDIEVVGETAAFSTDGAWFAFSARPADGSAGPDVYVWRVGDPSARNLSEDGDTIFASWDGDQVVASRPEVVSSESTTSAVAPVSVLIDPTTGVETPAGDLWLPAVDPTRSRAIAWSGSIQRDAADGTTWTAQDGQLELRAWSAEDGGAAPRRLSDDDATIVTDQLGAFDIRWDETGEWVAVWVASKNDAAMGRLTLYRVDPATGRLRLLDDAPDGAAALPGFSIGEGRLAWASPPGQEGEGSRIRIVAWSGDGVGSVESAPGEDLVIIR